MFINFSNHPSQIWSREQTDAARGYGAIVDVPFPAVPPDASEEEIQGMAEQSCMQIASVIEGVKGGEPSAVHIIPDLGGNKEFLPLHCSLFHEAAEDLSDFLLIHVDRGAVDQAVPRPDRPVNRIGNGLGAVFVGSEGPDADGRNLRAVVKPAHRHHRSIAHTNPPYSSETSSIRVNCPSASVVTGRLSAIRESAPA